MKTDGFTRTCLALGLVFLAALTIKLVAAGPGPDDAQIVAAMPAPHYKVASLEEEFAAYVAEEGKKNLSSDWWDKLTPGEKWTAVLNGNARKGWRYHGVIQADRDLFLVFTR